MLALGDFSNESVVFVCCTELSYDSFYVFNFLFFFSVAAPRYPVY